MCAILGFNFEDKELAKRMCKLVEHRGPDSQGQFTDKNITLGHTRLSIIDLSSSAKQPMSDIEGDLHITFNGEIYNYLELRAELKKKHEFKTKSDTEVILAAYKEWGEACTTRLNGMWAFAIYDSKKKRLFLSRDRFGQKPLYYYDKDGKFIFASQPKSILKAGAEKEIDKNSQKYYYTYGYIPAPRSIFEHIKKLPQGHNLTYDLKTKTSRIKEYWQLDEKFKKKTTESEDKIAQKIRDHLDSSVKYRLIADVPVGAFLSGGVDSSAIVATIRKFKEDKVHTFSIGFDDSKYDETSYAKMMAEKLGTDHHSKSLSSDDCLNIFKNLTEYYDEPFADSSMIPTTAVSKLARKHVTVSLSGDAADETFGGYQTYKLYRYVKLYPSWLKLIPRIAKRLPVPEWAKQGLSAADYAGLPNHEIFARIRSLTKDQPISSEALGMMKPHFKFDNWIDNVTYSDLKTYLADDILVKVDRASMAVSLEARCPILDDSLQSYAATIPGNLKIKGRQTKYIFKKAVSDRVPKEILARSKKGFSIPIKNYIQKEWKSFIEDNLEQLSKRQNSGLSREYIRKIRGFQQSGKNDYSWLIYSMAYMNQWLDRWE